MLEAMIWGGLRVAATLLLMMGIVLALRGASAATRHEVWRAGFAVALLLPSECEGFGLPAVGTDIALPIPVTRGGASGASGAALQRVTDHTHVVEAPAPAGDDLYTPTDGGKAATTCCRLA